MKNPLSNVSLDALLCFHHVAAQQSLARAAKALGVSPPAVTHALGKLEEALGVTLCLRGRRGFRLTEAGKALFERTKVIVAQLDGYGEFLRDPGEFTGLLSIGLVDHFENDRLQAALDAAVRRFPKMRLNVVVAGAAELTRLVRIGELDAAFGVFFAKSEQLSYFEVGRTTTHYYVAKSHRLAKKRGLAREDLFGEGLMWVDDRRRSRQELEAEIFVDHPRLKMAVRAYTNQVDGALPVARSGFCVVPLAPRVAAGLGRELVELKVATKKPDYREECAFDPAASLSVAARFFLDHCRSG